MKRELELIVTTEDAKGDEELANIFIKALEWQLDFWEAARPVALSGKIDVIEFQNRWTVRRVG